MELVFRKLSSAESLSPQPGEICLVPIAGAESARRTLASHVFAKGPDGLVRGAGAIQRIVIDSDPKLDDMLAACILEAQLESRLLPQGLDVFCRHAAKIRDGIRSAKVPLEASVEGIFLAMRARAEHRIVTNDAAQRFVADWRRLATAIFAAAKQQLDPASDYLFAIRTDQGTAAAVPLQSVFQAAPHGAGEIGGGDFVREMADLEKDRLTYQRDLEAAQRGTIRPAGASSAVEAVLLSQPRCTFLKYWTRSRCAPPLGGPYPFLGIATGPGQWIFSIDPSLGISLKPLAERFQAAEKAISDRAGVDPWFDGAALGHHQIASPRGGTKLADDAVRRILKDWGWRTPTDAAPPRRFGIALAAACGLLLIVGAAAIFAWPSRRPDAAPETTRDATPAVKPIHDLYVLAVGVSAYKNIPSLRSAAPDADALAAAFKRQEGGLCPKVVTKSIKDDQATRGEIIDYALRRWLLEQQPLTRRSLAIVAFSGHGFVEPETGRYHFAPHDYDPNNQGSTGIFLADVQRYLATLPCPAIVLFDTCHSGASDENEDSTAAVMKNIQKTVAESRDPKGFVVMAACGRFQKANETARWGHGALTLSLLEGLDGKALYQSKDLYATPLPQPNGDGIITLKELDRYVTERVEVLSSEISSSKYRRQFAKTFTVGDINLGAVPIAVRK